MNIRILQTSKSDFINLKENFDIFSGHCAGVCYMPNTIDDILNEPIEKTQRRINQTKQSGHHSVYDHNYISLYLEDIPKLLVMFLNNERMYTTSEKSGRYTIMRTSPREEELYNKWLEIYTKLINDKYKGTNQYFSELRIKKLAQENARYLTSIFTPVSLVYTVSYRQLNILYSSLYKLSQTKQIAILEKLKPYIIELLEQFKNTGYIDDILCIDNKNRTLSLFNTNKSKPQEYFGDVYCTSYKLTLPALAEAQRHRTLAYNIEPLKRTEYYVPNIIRKNETLKNEWLKDLDSIKELYPQAILYKVTERGLFENFTLKLKERNCTFVLLELYQSTQKTLKKYYNSLKKSNHYLKEKLSEYNYPARCYFKDFKCTAPCGFPDGIKGIREI